jgi:peptidoglycan hydrolase-like protein with peptidoglycan-binding domain
LNYYLSRPRDYEQREPGYRELSEREYPDLWGYYWGDGARRRYAKTKQDSNRYRVPIHDPPVDPRLETDGKFGPLTEMAVIRFQRRCGIPDDGIVGPETWDLFFPLYTITVIIVRRENIGTATPPDTGTPSDPASPPAKRTTKLDNIAEQLGIQYDKTGASVVFVMQGTWQTSRLPDEFLPGHWEHTAGAQIVTPLHSPVVGRNLQAYYQISRAEVKEVELSEKLKLSADLWMQPYVQFPLDGGGPGNPNTVQAGVNAGGTVQLEILKDPNDSPTVKVFVQGQVGAVVAPGGVSKTAAIFAGLSFEFEPDEFFGRKQPKRAQQAQEAPLRIDPQRLTIKPGTSGKITLNFAQGPQEPAALYFNGLPSGVQAPMAASVVKFAVSQGLTFSADANAPDSQSVVTVQTILENQRLSAQFVLVVKR